MSEANKISSELTNPVRILQNLIQCNTTNPPGNETQCLIYIKHLLESMGLKTMLVGSMENRQNLVATLEGRGEKPPLLMYGHIDVVTTEFQNWDFPPFDGVIADGCVWGRGALDMKGALAMMICSVIQAKKQGIVPAGDVILTIVCDEENGGILGAKYMVDNYSDVYKNVKYAIGEIGGFTMKIGKKRFYPIMIAEKQKCSIYVTIHGSGGHGSVPVHNEAMAKLGYMLSVLNKKRLPIHVTPPTELMLNSLYSNTEFPLNIIFKGLSNAIIADKILDRLGDTGKMFDAVLHNTVNATIVRGGHKSNVIPSEINVELDGRILPGLKPENLIDELEKLLGKEYEYGSEFLTSGPDKVDMGLFEALSDILMEGDPSGIPIPFVVSGATDARYFSKLGIQTYGFTPMKLPEGIDFSKLIHSGNERIPIKALDFGVEAISKLIMRY